MRLAVVGWASDSGVGRELVDAVRNLPVSSAFVLDNQVKPTRRDLVTVPHRLAAGGDLKREMEEFIDLHRPDSVLTWETPGSWDFPEIWARKGVRWVHVVHWDWFSPASAQVWRRAALVAPNRMCQAGLRLLGLESALLPVPVDTERLAFRRRTRAGRFISVYAQGGINERRSLGEILGAWASMADPPALDVLAQREPPELSRAPRPPSVRIMVGNAPEPRDLYAEGDVAVQPSRYEGVGVSMVEAQSCGLPVVTVDAPPMNEVAPDLLVPVERTETIEIMGKPLSAHVASVEGLRRRVEGLKGSDISELSGRARDRAEKEYSWTCLRPRWLDLLSGGRG